MSVWAEIREQDVIAATAGVLRDPLADRAPSPEDLVVPFRILRSEQQEPSFDYGTPETVGAGFGPAETQWLTTIALNLVSMLLWVAMVRGVEHLSRPELYAKTREEILKRASAARSAAERLIDNARNELLRLLGK